MKVLQQFLTFWKGLRFRLHFNEIHPHLGQLGFALGMFTAIFLSGFELLLSLLVLSLTGILYSLLGYSVLIGFLIGLSFFVFFLIAIISHLFKGIFPLSELLVGVALIYLLYRLAKKHITMERFEKFTGYFYDKEEAWINAFAFEQATLETVRKKQIWFVYADLKALKTDKVNATYLYITEAESKAKAQQIFDENVPEFEGEERVELGQLHEPSSEAQLTEGERRGLADHILYQALWRKIKKRDGEYPPYYKVTPYVLNRSN